MDFNTNEFFFGRVYNLAAKQALAELTVFYDPADLTTHAVITGMTGSGKTGMGISPAWRGGSARHPSHSDRSERRPDQSLAAFPGSFASGFCTVDRAGCGAREGKTVEQAAADAALASWAKGLADWGIDKARIQKLADSVDYAVYTPGSSSAIPVSILSSLKCPAISWEEIRSCCGKISPAL